MSKFLLALKNFFKKISASVWGLVAVLIVFTTLCSVHIGLTKVEKTVSSFATPKWVSSNIDGTDDELATFVTIKANDMNGAVLKSVWLKLDEVDTSSSPKVYIYSHANTSSSGNGGYGFGEVVLDLSDAKNLQWFNVATSYNEVVGKGSMFTFTFVGDLTISEIALVGVYNSGANEGDLVQFKDLSIEYAGFTPATKSTMNSPLTGSSSKKYNYEETKVLANAMIDEQDSFNVSNIEREVTVDDEKPSNTKETHSYTGSYSQSNVYLGDALNLFKDKGNVVNHNVNVLGSQLIGLSVAMFGETSFGVHFLSLLMAIGSISVVFFIAKRFAKKDIINIAVTATYAVVLMLFFTILGVVVAPIVALFASLAVFFMSKFFVSGFNTKGAYTPVVSIMLSGVFTCLAILSKVTAVIILPAVIALLVLRIVKDIKVEIAKAKANGKAVSYYNMYVSILSAVVGFILAGVVLTVATYFISGTMLTAYFGESSLLKVIFKNMGVMFGYWL